MAGKRKGKPFGGMTVRPDGNLAKVVGKGKLPPTKMTKNLWNYFKRKKLLVKTKSGPFGGMKVKADAGLKAIGVKGTIPPSKVFKGLWAYIKRKKLMKK